MIVRRFDVVRERKTRTLVGEIEGERAYAAFASIRKAHLGASSIVWNIDLTKCRAADYRFIAAFLNPILDQRDTGDSFVAIACEADRQLHMVRWGLAWRNGVSFAGSNSEALVENAIRQAGRHITVLDKVSNAFHYVGVDPMSESDLLAVLRFAEGRESFDADMIKDGCGMKAAPAVRAVEELQKRRLIAQVSDDTTYTSIAFCLRQLRN